MSVAVQPVVFARELFASFYADAKPLLQKHWQEIATFLDIPLDPDEARYQEAEDSGALRIYTMREGEMLIGYAVFVVCTNAHYSGSLQAVQDIVFVDPDYRRGGTGLKLLRYAERELRLEDVEVIYHHVKLAHPRLGSLLERMGYSPNETIYAKRLT